MKIYPAIDLWKGRCVRLYKGDFNEQKEYGDPLEKAIEYRQAGAEYLHIIDLEGAKSGTRRQAELIEKIVHVSGLKVQVGGGIRNEQDALSYLDRGADRIILGSMAVKEPTKCKAIIERLGFEQVTIALDFRETDEGYCVSTDGWQSQSQSKVEDLIKFYQELGDCQFLCTDIGKDGTMAGANWNFYQKMLAYFPGLNILVSGGVQSLTDVSKGKGIGAFGMILGKAIYEQRFSLKEALAC
ncbi:MAG: 1-(5-phosphoribosyl)-5-[(5-phosphoribosylamino)methylideneamino]imidazole-4-carboxamide isomerase [Oligoflexales bacterium]